jgi:hypothetical protein
MLILAAACQATPSISAPTLPSANLAIGDAAVAAHRPQPVAVSADFGAPATPTQACSQRRRQAEYQRDLCGGFGRMGENAPRGFPG